MQMGKIKFTDSTYHTLDSMINNLFMSYAVSLPNDSAAIFDSFETLYHYTDLNGLIGIVQNQTLWATNVHFLNDKNEQKYGIELVKEIAESIKNIQNDKVIELIINHIDDRAKLDDYITCFSKNGDLLGQWRAYANNGSGVSIGFNHNYFENNLNLMPFGTHIIYDEVYHRVEIKTMLESFISFMDSYKEEIDWVTLPYEEVAAMLIIDNIKAYIKGFKHPCFKDENEYRFIFTANEGIFKEGENYEIQFRTNNKMVIPFIKFENSYQKFYKNKPEDEPQPHFWEQDKRLPITEIIIGPNLDYELIKEGIEILLNKSGYKNVEIKKSVLPYRI
jgi:Protein of unknown function (DUF2971)